MFGIFSLRTDLPECVAADGIQYPINLLQELSSSDQGIAEKIALSNGF